MELWDPTVLIGFIKIVGAQVVAVFQKKGQKPCLSFKSKTWIHLLYWRSTFRWLASRFPSQRGFYGTYWWVPAPVEKTKGKTMGLNWLFSECFSDEQVENTTERGSPKCTSLKSMTVWKRRPLLNMALFAKCNFAKGWFRTVLGWSVGFKQVLWN